MLLQPENRNLYSNQREKEYLKESINLATGIDGTEAIVTYLNKILGETSTTYSASQINVSYTVSSVLYPELSVKHDAEEEATPPTDEPALLSGYEGVVFNVSFGTVGTSVSTESLSVSPTTTDTTTETENNPAFSHPRPLSPALHPKCKLTKYRLVSDSAKENPNNPTNDKIMTITLADFERLYVNSNQPVILTDVLDNLNECKFEAYYLVFRNIDDDLMFLIHRESPVDCG